MNRGLRWLTGILMMTMLLAPACGGDDDAGQRPLAVLRRRSDAIQLAGLMRETFHAPSLGTITFVRVASGEVGGFTISNDYARHVSFARLAIPAPARN